MVNNNQIDPQAILKEILPIPSEKNITVNRFSEYEEHQAANCSGKCSSGICRTLT